MDVQLAKDINVMVLPWVLEVQIYEQPMVVHHNRVVHAMIFFSPIKLLMMGHIVQRLIDFDEGPINKSDVVLKLWKLCH